MIQHKAIPALLHLTAQTGIQPVGSAQGGTQARRRLGKGPPQARHLAGQQHEPQTGGSGGRKRLPGGTDSRQTGRRSFRGLLRHAQQQVGQVHAGRHAHALRRQAPGQQIRDAPRTVGARQQHGHVLPCRDHLGHAHGKEVPCARQLGIAEGQPFGHARTAGGAHRDHARHLVTRDTEQHLAGAQIVGRGERQSRQFGKIMQRIQACRGPAPDPGQTLPIQRTVCRHMAKIGIEQLQLACPHGGGQILGVRRTALRRQPGIQPQRERPGMFQGLPDGRGQERRRLPRTPCLCRRTSPQARRCG